MARPMTLEINESPQCGLNLFVDPDFARSRGSDLGRDDFAQVRRACVADFVNCTRSMNRTLRVCSTDFEETIPLGGFFVAISPILAIVAISKIGRPRKSRQRTGQALSGDANSR